MYHVYGSVFILIIMIMELHYVSQTAYAWLQVRVWEVQQARHGLAMYLIALSLVWALNQSSLF